MPNSVIQGLRQQSVRDQTSTARNYNEDWHALFDADAIAAGPFNGRFILWLQARLVSTTANLPGLMQEYAVAKSVMNWNAVSDVAP